MQKHTSSEGRGYLDSGRILMRDELTRLFNGQHGANPPKGKVRGRVKENDKDKGKNGVWISMAKEGRVSVGVKLRKKRTRRQSRVP